MQQIKKFGIFLLSFKGRIIVGILFLIILFWKSLPSPLFHAPTSYVLEDEQGNLLSASIATDGQWRFPEGDDVPDKFAKCIVTYEDKRFYYHPGIDLIAMARAIRQNLTGKRIVSGGSTLSMQVIRLSRQRQRTFGQKLIELYLTLRLEAGYSKKSILKLYSANAPFGSNVVGLEAASWRYFGRAPQQLSWAETATLAVLPNAPSLVHPGRNRQLLMAKRNLLLDKLLAQKIIDKPTNELSKLEPLPDKPLALPQFAPHLLSRFKKEYQDLGLKSTRLESTLQGSLQQQVNTILSRFQQNFKASGINNAAALVLDVESGKALAYVGNTYQPNAPSAESYVDMITSLRSPGSTLKPILYASMLSDGLILPNSLIADIPTQIGGYSPQNYDLGYDGAIPASRALSRSLNIPAVKMLQQYKYPRFYDQLKKVGINSLKQPADHYGLSMILGGCEVSMWQLAGAYASMARTLNHYDRNGGNYGPYDYHPPTYLKSDSEKQSAKRGTERASILDHASLYFTFQAMNEVMRPGEEALWDQFSSSKKIAWKTGTSFGFRDAWAIGLTSGYVVCVWVGNADGEGRPGLVGVERAAPILFDIFDLLPATPWFQPPLDRMVQTAVCRQSGYLAGPNCPDPDTLYIQVPGVKAPVCPYHRLVHVNKAETYQVTADCEASENIQSVPWFVLPPTMEYYYRTRHQSYRELPPYAPGCGNNNEQDMELIYPKPNARIYIPLEIDGQRGRVIFSAAHRKAAIHIYWHLDDVYMGTTQHFHQLSMDVQAGKHRLTLVDENGNRLSQYFEILKK
ncbi:penicillin-binding protein 1C [bacterium A37T11]|nr:penicillin-binding protein 1C [bacterium A37T11]